MKNQSMEKRLDCDTHPLRPQPIEKVEICTGRFLCGFCQRVWVKLRYNFV